VAEADTYLPFMETVPQDVYHLSNRLQTAAEYLAADKGDHLTLAMAGSVLRYAGLMRKPTFGK
jgi:hypothetical protein